jgi:multiple sugar transport system permease protein
MRNFIARNREGLTGAAYVYPGLIFMILMIGYPIVYNFIISFQDIDVMTVKNATHNFVGFQNYIHLWTQDMLPQALRQTLTFTFWCILFQFLFGLLLALFFSRDFKAAKPVRGLLLVIWVVPMTVTALIFKFMFQTDGGLINVALRSLGLIQSPIEWLINPTTAMISIIIANCWVGIPFNMILLTAGLKSIPGGVYESASIDGATGIKRFFHITLPLLRPAMMSVLILGVIYTFKVFDLVYVMTSGGPMNTTELMSTYAYRLSFKQYQFSLGAAAACVLFLCLILVAAVYLKLVKKDEVM